MTNELQGDIRHPGLTVSPPMSPSRLIVPATFLILGTLALLLIGSSSAVDEYLPVGYQWGTLFAHAALAATWTVFGPLRFFLRLPMILLWLTTVVFAIGMHEGGGVHFILYGFSAFYLWMALQVPLWGLALFAGVRLRQRRVDTVSASLRTQFGIRQIMVFTIIVSLALAFARISFIWLSTLDELLESFYILTYLIVFAALISLPLILTTLLPRHALRGTLAALILVAPIIVEELLLAGRFIGLPFGSSGMWYLISTNAFTMGWILIIAGLVRRSGYRWQASDAKEGI